jgi:hypothetical protein
MHKLKCTQVSESMRYIQPNIEFNDLETHKEPLRKLSYENMIDRMRRGGGGGGGEGAHLRKYNKLTNTIGNILLFSNIPNVITLKQ